MKLFLKRFFAVLLSVCVAASALTVSAAAVLAEAAFVTVGGIIVGEIISWCARGGAEVITDFFVDKYEEAQILEGRVNAANFSDDTIVCYYDEFREKPAYVFSVNDDGLNESDREIAHFVCDYLNENFDIEEAYDQGKAIAYYNGVGMQDYEKRAKATYVAELKTEVYNAMNALAAKEAHEARTGQRIDSITQLNEILGDSVPKYDFSFTGPTPTLSFTSPEVSKATALFKEGFTFTPAASFTPGQTSFTQEQLDFLASYAPDFIFKDHDYIKTFSPSDRQYSLYGFNYYFMTDDGSLYFSTFSGYSSTGDLGSLSYPLSSATGAFYDVSGKMITGKSALDIKSRITSVGVVLNTGNQVQSSIPVNVTDTLTDEDFKITSGGVEIVNGIPRTGIENILGGAIGAGLIAADAPLTIGADGSITAADGIPIDKLGEILEALQSGNLNLDSIADYLSLISTLVGNGNLTMTEQQKILENVNANTKAGAKDLAKIREAIDELTKEYEWEAEDEDTDKEASWFTLEHTGMKEAEKLVGEVEMVKQSKELLSNLLGEYKNVDSAAPTFSFYWDSDKDGITEKYTILDLSFMEQGLSNSNISDKRRYRSYMTVRGFVQYLILLVSYVSFAIKVLKRLPSIIGGAGEAGEDFSTIVSGKDKGVI